MNPGEVIILVIFLLLGVGNGVREYALFIAHHRKADGLMTYMPDRLFRRLGISALIMLISLSTMLAILTSRSWEMPILSAVLLMVIGPLILLVFYLIIKDFRDTVRQYRSERHNIIKEIVDAARRGERVDGE